MAEIGRYYLFLVTVCLVLMSPAATYGEDAWVFPKEDATQKEEKMIFEGCTFKAEMIFYVAQEKIYNHGNTDKLLKYLKDNMTMAEFRVNEQFMAWIGRWVDEHSYPYAHEYARAIFYECVSNSYKEFGKQPTDRAAEYVRRFEENIEGIEERLLPSDGTEVEA